MSEVLPIRPRPARRAPNPPVSVAELAPDPHDYTPPVRENGLLEWNIDKAFRSHVLACVIDYCDGDVVWASREMGRSKDVIYRYLRIWAKEEGRGTTQDEG